MQWEVPAPCGHRIKCYGAVAQDMQVECIPMCREKVGRVGGADGRACVGWHAQVLVRWWHRRRASPARKDKRVKCACYHALWSMLGSKA